MTWGVELEYVLPRPDALAAVIQVTGGEVRETRRAPGGYRSHLLSTGWWVGFDPSLRADGADVDCCVELNSPVLTDPESVNWPALFSALARAGARVTPRCGLHVHVGGAGLWPAFLVELCRRTRGVAVPAARRRFLRPVPTAVLDLDDPTEVELQRAWFSEHPRRPIPEAGRDRLHPARRRVINLGSVWYRGTVEFRWFNSTLAADDLRVALHQVCGLIDSGDA